MQCQSSPTWHHGHHQISHKAQDHQKKDQEFHLAPVRLICQNFVELPENQRHQQQGVQEIHGSYLDVRHHLWEQQENKHKMPRIFWKFLVHNTEELVMLLMYDKLGFNFSQYFFQELQSHYRKRIPAGYQSRQSQCQSVQWRKHRDSSGKHCVCVKKTMKRGKSTNLKRYMNRNVHSSIIYSY